MISMPVVVTVAALVAIYLYRQRIAQEVNAVRTQPKAWLWGKWKNWGEPLLVAAVLAVVIRTFFFGPYKIPTGSMRTTFLEGDRIFVDKISYRFNTPKRGDIIVFKYPLDKKKDFVKRLAGLPGDRILIEDGKLIINGEVMDNPPFSEHYYYNRDDWDYGKTGMQIDVPQDRFFVLGDNSAQSSDSRNWGFVPKKNLIGRAFFIWWPLKRVKAVQ